MPRASQRAPLITFCLSYQMPTLPPAVPRRSSDANCIPCLPLQCPLQSPICRPSPPLVHRSGEAKGIPADIRASRPTIFCSVPRVLERFEITVMDKASAADFGLPWVHSKARPCGTMGLGPRKCGMAGLGHDSGVPGASTPAQLCRMPAGVDALRCLQHGMAWCTLQVSLPHLVRLDIALVCR